MVIDVSKGSNIFILRYKQPEKMVLDCLFLETNTPWSLDIPLCFYKATQLTTKSRSTERIIFKLGVSNINNLQLTKDTSISCYSFLSYFKNSISLD